MLTKICSMCKQEKSLDDFHKGTGKLKKRSQCKICCKKYDTPERIKKIIDNKQLKRDTDPVYRKKELEMYKEGYRKNVLRYLIRAAKSRAKSNNWEFNISVEDLVMPEYCPLLNIKLQINLENMAFNSYSLDRIDNKKGYIKGNVWVISLRANILKNNATLEELKTLVKNLEIYLDNK